MNNYYQKNKEKLKIYALDYYYKHKNLINPKRNKRRKEKKNRWSNPLLKGVN